LNLEITYETRDDCYLDDSYKLGFLTLKLQTLVGARDRDRARVRLGIGFKVVIIYRYALENVSR